MIENKLLFDHLHADFLAYLPILYCNCLTIVRIFILIEMKIPSSQINQ